MRLLLSRHGNTFGSGDSVVCAGARNDLPLVPSGKIQAEKLAEYLKKSNIIPTTVYCSPLQRTIEYAKIAFGTSKAIIDPRLNELDYGDWTGLTTPEIAAKFGLADFENWEKNSLWSKQGNWGSSESRVIQEVQSFSADLTQQYGSDDTVLVITSNGRLRYFLTLIPNAFEQHIKNQTFKVATGNICEMVYAHKQWQLIYWNASPHAK
jgi:broad specificity phosphatase PhoE